MDPSPPPDPVNPYAPPDADLTGRPSPVPGPLTAPAGAIRACVVLNALLALVCLVWSLAVGCGLIYGLFFSGDRGQELMHGIAGVLLLGTPGVVGSVLYAGAAIGLGRRRSWGYGMHLAGAGLAGVTCVGLPYTVVALVLASRPGFSDAFSRR